MFKANLSCISILGPDLRETMFQRRVIYKHLGSRKMLTVGFSESSGRHGCLKLGKEADASRHKTMAPELIAGAGKGGCFSVLSTLLCL